MQIEQLDPADTAGIRACYAVFLAAQRVDEPAEPLMGERVFGAWVTFGFDGEPREVWLIPGRAEGSVAGWYLLELPDLENLDRTYLRLWVHPDERRHGLGRALLRHAAGRAAAHGRTVLDGGARNGTAGEAFARQAGAEPGLVDIERLLEPGRLEDGRLAGLRAEAERHATGYELVTWIGPVPEEHIEQMVALYAALGDAPRDPGVERGKWDAQRVRERINGLREHFGTREYAVVARHVATGEMAALTQVGVDPADPGWGFQLITAVIEAHRGHRLGLLVKAAMLEWLATAEPQLERVTTWNAEDNKYMIAVNEALGYTVFGAPATSWRLDVADLVPGVMRIERFGADADPGLVRSCHDIMVAAAAADDPGLPVMSRTVFDGWLTTGWTGEPRETWLGCGPDGSVPGWYLLEVPDRDNRHLGIVDLFVDPARRRQGFGTALLRHAAERALADGRELLAGFAVQGSPGEAFARSLGATAGLLEIRRRLDLAAVPAGLMAELRASAQEAAAGYTLISWTQNTPEEYLDRVVAIELAMADAPHDPNWEPSAFDTERVRATDRRRRLQKLRSYTVAARHDATGDLAGVTQAEVAPDEAGWIYQGLTAVVRAHRGHRLGLLVKLAMMEWLVEAEPERRWMITGNAETNEHMIAINEALGYQRFGRPVVTFEIPAADVLTLAQS
jgi:GNAT superfamily N-acetyltransferase